jgi:hypothetical protein
MDKGRALQMARTAFSSAMELAGQRCMCDPLGGVVGRAQSSLSAGSGPMDIGSALDVLFMDVVAALIARDDL